MKFIKLLFLMVISSIVITSCSKKNNLGKMIPKEAAVVIHLNSNSLLTKVSWDEIKRTYWYSQLMSDTGLSATSKTFIDDPAKTGIDLKSDMVFFILNPDNKGQFVVEGNLKDSKTFTDFIKNMHPNTDLTKDGQLNIYKNDSTVIGWNNERFAFVSKLKDHNIKNIDSMENSLNRPVSLPPPSDSLSIVCKKLFSLSDDNSMYKNEKFASLTEEKSDVHVWININELSKGSMPGMPGMAGMIKIDKFLVDNISTGTINFENGKITGSHKQYYGKELSEILKKGDGNINTDMIKRLPSQNVAAVSSLHFTPGNLLEIIKLTGLDGFINLILSAQGLSLDDIVKATKGDVLFAVSDIKMKNDTNKMKELTIKDTVINFYNKTDATFLFAVAVGDKDAFNKLLGFTNKMGKDSIAKNTFQKTDGKYFVISNKQDAVNKYFSGTQSNPDFLSKISDHPMGGYVDIQMILKALQIEITKDTISKFYYNRNLAMWNNIYFKGGEYKNGGLVSDGELNLMDKNTNSLKQLNQYIDDISKVAIEEKKKKEQKKQTINLPPPPVIK